MLAPEPVTKRRTGGQFYERFLVPVRGPNDLASAYAADCDKCVEAQLPLSSGQWQEVDPSLFYRALSDPDADQ